MDSKIDNHIWHDQLNMPKIAVNMKMISKILHTTMGSQDCEPSASIEANIHTLLKPRYGINI